MNHTNTALFVSIFAIGALVSAPARATTTISVSATGTVSTRVVTETIIGIKSAPSEMIACDNTGNCEAMRALQPVTPVEAEIQETKTVIEPTIQPEVVPLALPLEQPAPTKQTEEPAPTAATSSLVPESRAETIDTPKAETKEAVQPLARPRTAVQAKSKAPTQESVPAASAEAKTVPARVVAEPVIEPVVQEQKNEAPSLFRRVFQSTGSFFRRIFTFKFNS